MIPELGTFAIILTLCFTLLQSLLPLAMKYTNMFNHDFHSTYSNLMRSLISVTALGQFIFITFAMLCLMICFIQNDMTVLFVREHSHELLPLIYRVGAAWSGHEGSLLLWCFILSFWTAAFNFFHDKQLVQSSTIRIMMILGWINAGFIIFLLTTSNPFIRDFPTEWIVGNDLVPLLQDPGLIFHPPILYLGYVGFVIGFAFAISALIEGKLTNHWVTALRPWIILPWAFLGAGIVLGSWWAYRELGWGGWWFWDPVENASLLPWLAATGLIHSLIVTEKRGDFKGWTLLLAIITFILSLLGTFLVRSGILVSVHAFASDPTRGLFLLSYLTIIISGTLLLYSIRIPHFYKAPTFQLFSRETFLLINSVILLSVLATIVIGTLYPIFLDVLGMEKISVGEPYFNIVFIPMMLPLFLLMGLAPHVSWGQNKIKPILKKIYFTFILSLLFSISGLIILGFEWHLLPCIGVFIGIWIILSTLQYTFQKSLTQRYLTSRNVSMIIAHIGLAIMILGITINKSYSEERQVKISPGETVILSHYQIHFTHISEENTPHFESIFAHFIVEKNNGDKKSLSAEERLYHSHEQSLSKPGILFNTMHDLYVVLGHAYTDGSWSVRMYYKPCVRWIWAGGFFLLLGGLLTLIPYFEKYVMLDPAQDELKPLPISLQ